MRRVWRIKLKSDKGGEMGRMVNNDPITFEHANELAKRRYGRDFISIH